MDGISGICQGIGHAVNVRGVPTVVMEGARGVLGIDKNNVHGRSFMYETGCCIGLPTLIFKYTVVGKW
jgi:hypothetical protein